MGKASRLFNGTAEQTLHSRITPTPEQREFLQTRWNSLAEHLKAELAGWGVPHFDLATGLLQVRHIDKARAGEEYDVDVGIYFSWDPKAVDVSPTAVQLRTWVQQELLQYKSQNADVKHVEEPAKERCSRLFTPSSFILARQPTTLIQTPKYVAWHAFLASGKTVIQLLCTTSSKPLLVLTTAIYLKRLVRLFKGLGGSRI